MNTQTHLEIRQATIEDLPFVAPTAERFYQSTACIPGTFNLDLFVSLWTQILEAGNGVIYLAENNGEVVGGIGGFHYPEQYSGERVAMEMFWYCLPEFRGYGVELYKMFEEWAREEGCIQLRMVHLADSMPDRLEKVYSRWGYRKVETHYMKELR